MLRLEAMSLLLMPLSSLSLAADLAQPAPVGLCSRAETTVFSCAIGTKTVSLCEVMRPPTSSVVLVYRFGIPGRTPELEYPRQAVPAAQAFRFTTIGGPLWVISFDRGDASYDIMSDLEAVTLPPYKFTGIGVTTARGATRLRSCNAGAVVMNMRGLDAAGYFPEYGPAAAGSPFKVVSKTTAHGSEWTSKVEYPVIGDPGLDGLIQGFARDCYPQEAEGAGHCSQTVAAELVKERYLVLTFDSFEYMEGAPHGSEDISRRTYARDGERWVPIAKNSLIAASAECRSRYASLVDRRVRPQLPAEFADKVAPEGGDLFAEAEQVLTADGVRIVYEQYALGPRVSPQGILIPFEDLGDCFSPQVAGGAR